jgi:glucose-6-phosphate isomerase
MELRFGEFSFKPEVRKASDLKPVLAFPEYLTEDFDAYYMFRDSYKKDKDHERILEAELRFDYTVMLPANIGGERIKTYGHYHPDSGCGLSYPEIYQVLEGEAIYILQKRGERPEVIEDCIVVFASEGDVVLVPPDYGHVTVNSSSDRLVMTNWVCRSFSSLYDDYTRLRGACYYYINEDWVKNERYLKVPSIRFADPIDFLGLKGEDMYSLVEDLSSLEFLRNPEKVGGLTEYFNFKNKI